MDMISQMGKLAAGIAVLLAGAASAQPIEFNGNLANGDETLDSGEFVDTYDIELRQGELVELQMISEDVDAYLIIQMPDGEQYENDDSNLEDLNAGLAFIAPQTGTYTLMATTAGPDETGRYQITGVHRPAQPLEKQKGELIPGDQVNWKGGEYCDLIEIQLTPGETRAIELTSDAFDTYLVAHGPGGQVLVNDDSVDLNSSMLVLEGGAQGRAYTLVVTSYAAAETGPYRLTSWKVAE